ncbi:DoxX family protein [Saccharopolyspora cebuensis]|uniref:DoxX family protein n=1 Tax=Saccharopolyspora cebuensis TaxID=418759 RepID=A0ABV4CIL3_9PSEU
MRILLGVLSGILALVFLAIGAMKIFNTEVFVGQLGLPSGMVVVLGLLEVAGALGLLAGFKIRVLGAAAAIGLVLMMLGAVGFHVISGDLLQNGLMPVVLLIVAAANAVLQFRIGVRPVAQVRTTTAS